MTKLQVAAMITLALALHQKDTTDENRQPKLSNVVVTLDPIVDGAAVGSVVRGDDTGNGWAIRTGSNVGNRGLFNITGHLTFPDGENYDIALQNSDGVVGPETIELGDINDAEAGDTLTVTFVKVDPTPATSTGTDTTSEPAPVETTTTGTDTGSNTPPIAG